MDEIHIQLFISINIKTTEVEKGAITFDLYFMIIYPYIKCKLYNPSEFMAVVFCSSMHAFIAPSKLKPSFHNFLFFHFKQTQ